MKQGVGARLIYLGCPGRFGCLCRRHFSGFYGSYLYARREFVDAFGHNLFVGSQASFYYHLVLEFGTELYEATFHGRVAAHHIDVGTTFFYNNRFLGYYGRVFAYIEQQFYLGKLTG